jgi:hypothetical protein
MQRLPQRLLPVLAAVAALALPASAHASGPTLLHGPTVYTDQPSVDLEWTGLGSETGFDVYGPDCLTLAPLDTGLGDQTFTATEPLGSEGEYCFQILGYYGGPTDVSNVLHVVYDATDPDAPDPQFDTTGTTIVNGVTAGPVVLEWDPVDDGSGSGVDDYAVQRTDSNGVSTFAVSGATTWSDPDTTTEGSRSYLVTAIDRAGNRTAAAAAIDVSVDLTAPVPSIDDQPPSTSPDYENVPFAVSSDDPDAELSCWVDADSPIDCSGGDGTWAGPLTNGSHTFNVTATDAVGNDASTSYTWTVASPATGVALAGPSGPTNQSTVAFTFSWAHPGATFQCQFDNGGYAPCSTGQTYSLLSDGNHTFDLQAHDPAGTVATLGTSFHVDTVAPTGAFSAPAGRLHGVVALAATGVGDADTGVDAIRYAYAGTASGTVGVVASGGVSWDTRAVPDGTYTLNVTVTDLAGNGTPLSASVIVDNSGPAAALDGPADGAILRGSSVTLTAHASDPAGVQNVQFQLGSGGAWLPLGAAIVSAGPYGATWNTQHTDDGAYQLRLAATDVLGNTAYSAPVSVVVDNGIPAAPGAPVAQASPTSAAPSIAWPASASPDVAGYDVYRAGQRVATGVTGTSYSDALAADGSQDGAYAYTVSAVDQAGNESSQSAPVAVIYDRTRPSAPGSLTATAAASGTVTLSWPAGTDPTAGSVSSGLAGYVLRRSTGEQVCAVAATVLTCSDTGRTPGATYAYTVLALDAAGNLSVTGAAATVTVPKAPGRDATAPARPAAVDAEVHGSKATVTWKNPKDRDFDHVVVVANAKHRPRSAGDGTRVYSGRATSAPVTGTPGTTVFVAIFAYDKTGNASAPSYASASFARSALLPANGSAIGGSPQLSWRGVARATYYNVQVFQGRKRVAVGWPHGTSFRVPAGKLRKGKTYTWYVWPGFGALKDAHYGGQVGHAAFTYTG